MFIKIQKDSMTVCYTGDQYAFNWRNVASSAVTSVLDETPIADITVWRDEKIIIDYPLKRFSHVYIMNDSGKTIDTFTVN